MKSNMPTAAGHEVLSKALKCLIFSNLRNSCKELKTPLKYYKCNNKCCQLRMTPWFTFFTSFSHTWSTSNPRTVVIAYCIARSTSGHKMAKLPEIVILLNIKPIAWVVGTSPLCKWCKFHSPPIHASVSHYGPLYHCGVTIKVVGNKGLGEPRRGGTMAIKVPPFGY